MTSQINSTSIDKTFPVAGQDNDSQGFRDNFDAIQQNFAYAKTELEELQAKAVLKGALTGDSLNNDLGGNNLFNGSYTNFHGTSYTQTATTSANIDILNGSLQAFELTNDDAIFTFINWPETGNYAKVRVHFKTDSAIKSVGNDIELGRRYTIDTVGTTDFEAMGAEPIATFNGFIDNGLGNGSYTATIGNVLTVTSFTGATQTLAVGDTIRWATLNQEVKISTKISDTRYTVDVPFATVKTMVAFRSGVVFVAAGSKGSGSGKVKIWKGVTLATENTGTIVTDSTFSLPIYVNPNGAVQVIEAWTYTGSTAKTVFVDYIGNLGEASSNYTTFTVGSINVNDTLNSSSPTTGSLVVAGGTGIVGNLNVGGNTTIDGNLTVNGSTVLTTSSIAIAQLDDVQDVVDNANAQFVKGDVLKYDPNAFGTGQSGWTNAVDRVKYWIKIDDKAGPGLGGPSCFYISTDGGATFVPFVDYDLKFSVGKKYRFILEDASNTNGPLRFATAPDTVVDTAYMTGKTYGAHNISESGLNNVYIAGTPGTTGAYIEIFVTEQTPSPLYLYAQDTGSTTTDKFGNEYPVQVGNGQMFTNVDYTTIGNQTILVDSSAGPVTISLEAGPRPGTSVTVIDSGSAETNAITIDPQGVLINDSSSNLVISSKYGSYSLVCDGTNWKIIDPVYKGNENLATIQANGDVISINTSVSYINTDGQVSPISLSLPDGRQGQTKVITMTGHGSDLVITVANCGWKAGGGSGTITLDAIGDSCILQFINTAWYPIANNNCVFDNLVSGQQFAVIVDPPAGPTDVGEPGQIAYDATYFYVCIATNTWYSISYRETVVSVPGTPTSTGEKGQVAYGSGYIYFCTGTNNWVRAWTENDFSVSSTVTTKINNPGTATSTGTTGQIAFDTNYIYVCVNTNTWKRVGIASW